MEKNNNKVCPKCNASWYSIVAVTSTLMYFPPIYKDGELINPDGNTQTTQYKCIPCGHTWEETE